jgi:hypothetical protein
MCDCANKYQVELPANSEKKYRLADFFNTHWEAYLKTDHPLITIEQYKAVSAMRVCRTAVLGVDHYVCKDCGEVVEVYHNCHHRFCPTCSWGDTIKWAERIKEQMMDLPHRHVVFTLPHALIPLVKRNDKHLLNVLLRTSADTFKDWAEHKYQLKLGIISVLHTFGETKECHLHVHMIVSWGGIDPKTQKLVPIKGEYVNYKFLQDKFRNKFEDCLVAMFDRGSLQQTFADRLSFLAFLKRINMTNWRIHLEPPMPAPSAVIRYIGRYSKRACLSENKITEIDGEYIAFKYKDYKIIGLDNKPVEKTERLHFSIFFPRLLQHVPLPRFHLVRYYGLYSTKSKIPQNYLNNDIEQKEEQREWVNPFVCSYCQRERQYLYTVFDIRPREARIVPFDVTIHPSYIFKRA